MTADVPREHHPTLCRTGRFGCWATCTCGWRSRLWTTTTGAHVEFGEHLATTTPNTEQHREALAKEAAK